MAARRRGADQLVFDPMLRRIGRDPIPEQPAIVDERNQIEPAVAVDVGGQVVVRGYGAVFESFPLFGRSAASRIAKPGAAGNLVYPAVGVDVESNTADIGAGSRAQQMPAPALGAAVFEPKHIAKLTPGDEIQVSVLIDVDGRCLAEIVAPRPIDLVNGKVRFAGQGQQGDQNGEASHRDKSLLHDVRPGRPHWRRDLGRKRFRPATPGRRAANRPAPGRF